MNKKQKRPAIFYILLVLICVGIYVGIMIMVSMSNNNDNVQTSSSSVQETIAPTATATPTITTTLTPTATPTPTKTTTPTPTEEIVSDSETYLDTSDDSEINMNEGIGVDLNVYKQGGEHLTSQYLPTYQAYMDTPKIQLNHEDVLKEDIIAITNLDYFHSIKTYLRTYAYYNDIEATSATLLGYRYYEDDMQFFYQYDDADGTLVCIPFTRANTAHLTYVDILPCTYTREEAIAACMVLTDEETGGFIAG